MALAGQPGPGRDTPLDPVDRIRGLPFTFPDPDPGFPEKTDPAPNQSESISVVSDEPEEPGKQPFLGYSRIRTTQ